VDRHPRCQKCNNAPTQDVHHCKYKNIYNVRDKDVLALCRSCHNLIERAKKLNYLRKEHSQFEALEITEELVNSFTKRTLPLTRKTLISICSSHPNCQKFICGILKINFPKDWLHLIDFLVSKKQLDHIFWALRNVSAAPNRPGRKVPTQERGRRIHYWAWCSPRQAEHFLSVRSLALRVNGTISYPYPYSKSKRRRLKYPERTGIRYQQKQTQISSLLFPKLLPTPRTVNERFTIILVPETTPYCL